jgi:hypothetical protein
MVSLVASVSSANIFRETTPRNITRMGDDARSERVQDPCNLVTRLHGCNAWNEIPGTYPLLGVPLPQRLVSPLLLTRRPPIAAGLNFQLDQFSEFGSATAVVSYGWPSLKGMQDRVPMLYPPPFSVIASPSAPSGDIPRFRPQPSCRTPGGPC